MTVFTLWAFDGMASNWGEYYLEGIYATEALALKKCDALNAEIRRTSPDNLYPMLARVEKVELQSE